MKLSNLFAGRPVRLRRRIMPDMESMEGKLLLSAASVTMMTPGQSIVSSNQQYKLLLDTNGDLAEYDATGKQLWHSGTAGTTAVELDLRSGNLVLVGTGSTTLWASHSGGDSGSYLDVQDNGDVVVDGRNGNMIWHTNTAQGTPTPSPAPTPTLGATTPRVFAPFIDVTSGVLSSPSSLTTLADMTGADHFSLGFITPDDSGNPVWGNTAYGIDSTYGRQVAAAVAQLRAQGGDVIISFGGQSATGGAWNPRQDLAQTAASAGDLAQKYQNVINAYHATHLDFDVEGASLGDAAATTRRSEALAIILQANPDLKISFTLPVETNGLQTWEGGNALNVLQSAVDHGVRFSGVNLMTMDLDLTDRQKADYLNNPDDSRYDMAHFAEMAGLAVVNQLEHDITGLNVTDQQARAMIGLIPELGANDGSYSFENFDVIDARQLEQMAETNGFAMLSMWSVSRDDANFDFAKAFSKFKGS